MEIIEEEEKINICIDIKSLKQEKNVQYLSIIMEEKGNLEPEVSD